MTDWFRLERTAVLAVDLQGENLPEGLRGGELSRRSEQGSQGVGRLSTNWFSDHLHAPLARPEGIDAPRYESLDDRGRPPHSVAGSTRGEIFPRSPRRTGTPSSTSSASPPFTARSSILF